MNKIRTIRIRAHMKASEKYIDTIFSYNGNRDYETSIPVEYRRTGTSIEESDYDDYLLKVYDEVNPARWDNWKKDQIDFWASKPNAKTTKEFFDVLIKRFEWCCVTCSLPKNPNWARRVQDIKEFGYTLATNTSKYCVLCEKNTTQLALVPIKRGGVTGYETWSPDLRNKIVRLLGAFDSYEAKQTKKEGLLPDHKFPEIRWDLNTKRHWSAPYK